MREPKRRVLGVAVAVLGILGVPGLGLGPRFKGSCFHADRTYAATSRAALITALLTVAWFTCALSTADSSPAAASTQAANFKTLPRVKLLGMILVDPTSEEMKQYQIESSLPLVLKVEDPSFFPRGMAPTQGCAFWIVEPPANGFLFNHEKNAGRRGPKTVRQLVEAILACVATPQEYQKLWDQSCRASREQAEKFRDKPQERERWMKIASSKMPPEEAGKYICRVVYNLPGQRGTTTTAMCMNKQDLEQLRGLLKK